MKPSTSTMSGAFFMSEKGVDVAYTIRDVHQDVIAILTAYEHEDYKQFAKITSDIIDDPAHHAAIFTGILGLCSTLMDEIAKHAGMQREEVLALIAHQTANSLMQNPEWAESPAMPENDE